MVDYPEPRLGDVADASVEEYVSHRDSNRVAAIAPHGGNVEVATDTQAFQLAEHLPDCSAWAYCGYVDGGGAFDRFHTESTEIDALNYRLLSRLTSERFVHAVAFHGFENETVDVYLGGRLAKDAREVVASRIAETTGLDVGVAEPGDRLYDEYGGASQRNLVNRLSVEGGLQIEQTPAARDAHSGAICEAVAVALERVR